MDQSNTTLANQPSDSSEENLGTECNDDGNRRLARIRLSKQLSDVAFTAQAEHTSDSENYFNAMQIEDYSLQRQMDDPILFLAKTDADTMYLHQAMAEPDRYSFKLAITKEIADHCKRKHWVVVPRSKVPAEQDILPAVWSMKRKRDLITRLPIKHKARINIHGGKEEYKVNYYETFSPVVTWITIRLTLTFAILSGWYSRRIDFVLAFPQAPIEFDMFMEIPKGIAVEGGSQKTYVLKLLKNLYDLKLAARQIYLHLRSSLTKLGFTMSKVDECLFFRNDILFIVYVDNGILYSRKRESIDLFVKQPDAIFDVKDKGSATDYLGVHFSDEDGIYKLTQTHLIDQLVKDVGLDSRQFKIPKISAYSTRILLRRTDEEPF